MVIARCAPFQFKQTEDNYLSQQSFFRDSTKLFHLTKGLGPVTSESLQICSFTRYMCTVSMKYDSKFNLKVIQN